MPKKRLLDQVDILPPKNLSRRTGKATFYWIKRFIFFHDKDLLKSRPDRGSRHVRSAEIHDAKPLSDPVAAGLSTRIG